MRFVPLTMDDDCGTRATVLCPFDADTHRFTKDLPRRPIEMEPLFDRNMNFHRKIFATLNEVAKALQQDPERLRAELLYKTGNCHWLGEHNGKVLISINSMSRHHMKDHELHAFWDDACQILRNEMLPEISDQAMRDRLADMLSLERG